MSARRSSGTTALPYRIAVSVIRFAVDSGSRKFTAIQYLKVRLLLHRFKSQAKRDDLAVGDHLFLDSFVSRHLDRDNARSITVS